MGEPLEESVDLGRVDRVLPAEPGGESSKRLELLVGEPTVDGGHEVSELEHRKCHRGRERDVRGKEGDDRRHCPMTTALFGLLPAFPMLEKRG